MTKQEQITDFLNRYVTNWPRSWGPFRERFYPFGGWRQRPNAEAVAKEFLGIAEFRELQLGTWLGTTNGEILTAAVEAVVPMFYAEDVELLVDALKIAAEAQQQQGQKKALATAVGAMVVIGLAGWGRAA